jgi:ribosomal protein S15P/S13E
MNMNKMISSKQYFQSDCFSGECGLCFNCNKNSSMDLNRKLNESDMLSGLSMSVRRSRDLLKYLGKKNMDEYTEFYNTKLFDWCKSYDYKDPFCYGYAPEKNTYNNLKFKLIEKKHSLFCDDIYCKMVYENTSKWEQDKRYPIMPIYQYENKNLCAVCVNKY